MEFAPHGYRRKGTLTVATDAPFHKVRWHVPAKSLGVTLPPGYHLLEAPLQLFLCYGDEEIARFASGTDPKEIQRQAETHFSNLQTVRPATAVEDAITGLPWSISLRAEAARLASTSDLHVIVVLLSGLDTLVDVYGYKAAHSVLRQISRRIKRSVDERDRLARHSGDKLLIFTTRPLDEIKTLVDMIHQQVTAIGLDTDGDRLPHSHIGVTTADRLTETDPSAAQAVIDAVIISAEVASGGSPAAPAHIPTEQPTTHAPQTVQPEPQAPIPSPSPAVPVAASPEPEGIEADDLHVSPTSYAESEASALEIPSTEPQPRYHPTLPLPDADQMESTPATTPDVELPASPEAGETSVQPAAIPAPTPDGTGRIRFKGASLDVSGMVATATVKLVYDDREVIGRAVGRNAQERRLVLAAEAAARAITEFLPQGYGVVVHDIQPAPAEVGKALWAVVLFLTPNGEESLLGIAPIDDMVFEAAGKAVLNAVNRRVGLLLGSPP